MINDRYEFDVRKPDRPSLHAWHCAERLVQSGKMDQRFVTKAEYAEHGKNICLRRFDDYYRGE